MPFDWDKCILEGEKSFDYMITNFYDMFNETLIKDFYIRYTTNKTSKYYEEVNEKYNSDIQYKLIPWIQKEFEENRLTNHTNWKPFRDSKDYTDMYLGYNKVFQYKNYIFQLALDSGCVCEECIPINKCGYNPCFELALFGWKDDYYEKIQPDNKFILRDNILPGSFWDLK